MSMENLIHSENNFFQSINKLEAQMSHYINIGKIGMRKLYLIYIQLFPIALVILIGMKNLGVLETLINTQFLHTNLNLTNSKPWTNW